MLSYQNRTFCKTKVWITKLLNLLLSQNTCITYIICSLSITFEVKFFFLYNFSVAFLSRVEHVVIPRILVDLLVGLATLERRETET